MATKSHSDYVILLLFHCNNGCRKVSERYVKRTLPVLLMLCTFVLKFSVQIYILCNVISSYISSSVFSRHAAFTLLLHQTVWQIWREEALATEVHVKFKCHCYTKLCLYVRHISVPSCATVMTLCTVWMQQTVFGDTIIARQSSFLNYWPFFHSEVHYLQNYNSTLFYLLATEYL
jgi:hypothetical protein